MSTQWDSRTLPPWWLLARDIGIFLFGVVVAFLEVRRPEVRDAVLVFAGGLLGGPLALLGASSVADAIRSRGGTSPELPSSPGGPAQPSGSP